MEQYRLLVMSAMPVAKMSFSDLDGLKRNVLKGVNDLQSGQADATAKKLALLRSLIASGWRFATQTKCESIAFEGSEKGGMMKLSPSFAGATASR